MLLKHYLHSTSSLWVILSTITINFCLKTGKLRKSFLDEAASSVHREHEPKEKRGRIHGNPVADGWAGAVMQEPIAIQKCDVRKDGPTDGPTDRLTRQGVESRVCD